MPGEHAEYLGGPASHAGSQASSDRAANGNAGSETTANSSVSSDGSLSSEWIIVAMEPLQPGSALGDELQEL